MRSRALRLTFAATAGVALLAAQAPAITIVRSYQGGSASNVAGGGTLQSVFNAAADCWEAALLDPHTVTITFSWASLGGGTLGVHNLVSQGGSPNREINGNIRFDSATPWFADSTPLAIEEYSTYTETTANYGGGNMIVGRVATGATGAAAGRWDLFSVALHEIGHALGMSSANTSFQSENADGDIDITAPRPNAGAALPTISGAHLNISTSLLYPSIGSSIRRLFSHADILANAQISRFNDVNLNAHPVPEPASLAVLGLGAAAILRRRRK